MNRYICKDHSGEMYQIQTEKCKSGWTVDVMFDVHENNHMQNIHLYSEHHFDSEQDAIELGQKIYMEESGKMK